MVNPELSKLATAAGLKLAISKSRNLSEFWATDWLNERQKLEIFRSDRLLLEVTGDQQQIDLILQALQIGLTYQ